MDTIDLNPQQDPAQPIVLDDGTTTPLSLPIATSRANDAVFALPNIDKKFEDYLRPLLSGKENELRKDVSTNVDMQKADSNQQLLQNYASRKGAPLTREDLDIIDAALNAPPTDPNSVLEEHYAKQYMDHLNWPVNTPDTSSWYNDAMKYIPQVVQQYKDEAEGVAAYRQFANTQFENAQDAYNNQSYLGWGIDLLKGAFQPYTEYKMRGLVPEVSKYSNLLLGDNIDEQIDYLYTLPFPEYKARVSQIMESLKQDNPSLAVQFGKYLVGATTDEKRLDNLFTLAAPLDVIGGVKTGLSVAKKVFLAGETRLANIEMVQKLANTAKVPVKEVAADAAGNLSEAASLRATTEAVNELSNVGEQAARKMALEALPDVLRTDRELAVASPGRFGQEIANRIAENYDTFETNLMSAVENISRLERLGGTIATSKATRAIQEFIRDKYPGLSNAILNTSEPYKVLDNWFADIVIGTHRGEYFMQEGTARSYREVYGIPDAVISKKKSGVGWYLLLKSPVDETYGGLRDLLAEGKNAKTPEPVSTLGQFADWLRPIRTPEEILSPDQRMSRKVALYGGTVLGNIYKQAAQDMTRLFGVRGSLFNRKEQQNFIRAVKQGRDMIDKDTGLKGYFFKSPQELETHYQQFIDGQLPSQKEIAAYFSYKRAAEMDRMMRNLGLYKYMSRIGAEHHAVYAVGEDGVRVYSNKFAGMIRNVFPGGEDGILVMSQKLGEEQYYQGGAVPLKTLEKLREDVKTGKKRVIEIYDPESRPLNGFGAAEDKRVRYIVTERSKTYNLPYDLIARRGGGHIEYDYEYYIKQAKIRPDRFVSPEGNVKFHHWYEGDATVMPMQNRVLGAKVIGHLEEFRKALELGDTEKAKAIAENLPIDYKEMKSWFSPSYGPNGEKIAPRLSLNEEFKLVSKGARILDIDNSYYRKYEGTFRDGTREGSAARQYQVEYTGQRDAYDLMTIDNKGTTQNPIWGYEPAKYVDPMVTMNRAMQRIVKSNFMDDYKIFSVENWLQEAQNYFQLPGVKDPLQRIRAAPFYYFENPPKWSKDADPQFTRRMDIARAKIRALQGIPSEIEGYMNSVAQNLADSVYSKETEMGVIPRSVLLGTSYAIANITEPVKFLRAATFHVGIGLFALPQILVQQMTYATIFGVAGDHAVPGTMGALLHGYARLSHNPAILDKLDEIASKMRLPGLESRWRPGEFKESYEEYMKTGFGNVAGNHILTDFEVTPRLFSNGLQKFLHAGQVFFNSGEKSVRAGAWHTAFREYREANPLGRITDYERAKILDRADLLAGNMTSASKSMLQAGPLALTTQFLGYQMRLAELMTGKRLNTVERTRLIATYALLYGVPSATGAVTVYPMGDAIKTYAINHGFVLGQDNNTAADTLMLGVPALLGALATGKLTGTPVYYNVGERWGAPGLDVIKQILSGDKPFWTLATGAVGSLLQGAWEANSGFRTMMFDAIQGKGKFAPKPDDVMDVLKQINSVNRTDQFLTAINTGKIISKSGNTVEKNVPGWDAVVRYITGLQSEQAALITLKRGVAKSEKENQEEGFKIFEKYMLRGTISLQNNDKEQATDYFRRGYRALEVAGWPPEKIGEALKRLPASTHTMIGDTDWSYYERNVPPDRYNSQQGAFRKQLNITKGQW